MGFSVFSFILLHNSRSAIPYSILLLFKKKTYALILTTLWFFRKRICCLHSLSRLLKTQCSQRWHHMSCALHFFFSRLNLITNYFVWKIMLAPEEDPKAHHRRVGCWCLVSAASPETMKFKSSFHQLESYFYLEWHLYIISSWKTETAAVPGSTKTQIKNQTKSKETQQLVQGESHWGGWGKNSSQTSLNLPLAPLDSKVQMAAASKMCHHRWWNMFVTLSLDFNKSLKKYGMEA